MTISYDHLQRSNQVHSKEKRPHLALRVESLDCISFVVVGPKRDWVLSNNVCTNTSEASIKTTDVVVVQFGHISVGHERWRSSAKVIERFKGSPRVFTTVQNCLGVQIGRGVT